MILQRDNEAYSKNVDGFDGLYGRLIILNMGETNTYTTAEAERFNISLVCLKFHLFGSKLA